MTTEIIEKPFGVDFAKDHMPIPFLVCGGYLIFINQYSTYMKNKEALSLKTPLIYWNASLCIFSFIGALQTVLPLSLYNMQNLKIRFVNTITNLGTNPWVDYRIFQIQN